MAKKTKDWTFGVAVVRPVWKWIARPAGPDSPAVENINPGDDGVTSPIGGLPQQNQPGKRGKTTDVLALLRPRIEGRSVGP